MAEAIVLGSGTSNGVPLLAVDHSAMFMANPKNHRTRPSLLIKAPEGNLLVDCPPELRLQLLRERIGMVHAVIITHTHADHIMGMDDLRAFCLASRKHMPMYTTPAYQDDVRTRFSYAFSDTPTGEVPRFELKDVQPVMQLLGLEVRTFTVMHGPTPVVGVRVNNFAYLTDVNHIPPEAEEQLQGLDVLVLDGLRNRPHPNHFNREQALEAAAKLGARMTYLTHLTHDYDHHRAEALLPEGVRLAYDGLRFDV